MQTTKRQTLFPILLGTLYIALMFCHIPFPWGALPLFWEDLLLPVMAGTLLLRGKEFTQWKTPAGILLLLFLTLAFCSALLHGFTDPAPRFAALSQNLYEPAVFLYGAILFFYFAEFPLPRRLLAALTFLLFLSLFLSWLLDWIPIHFTGHGFFHYEDPNFLQTHFSFLARRFAFTTDNPNLAGSLMVLPYVMSALVLCGESSGAKSGLFPKILLILAGLCLIPLCHTVSKHMLLTWTIFILLALYVCFPQRPLPRRLLWLPVMLVGLLFELTVLCQFFPLKTSAPYIQTAPGMYSIHQKAYARMLQEQNPVWTGIGPRKIRELYPDAVESKKTESILKTYDAEENTQRFNTYMDPHNEYLNLASLFGFTALTAMLAFLCLLMFRAKPVAFYFILALFFCMLWDDLLSKRWIWVSLGLLAIPRLSPAGQKLSRKAEK